MSRTGDVQARERDHIPETAWQRVWVHTREELQMPREAGAVQLEVTVFNDSSHWLHPDSGQGILFSFRLVGIEGPTLPFECVRTRLEHSVAPGQSHTQMISVAIPTWLRSQVTAIRVGLIQRGRYWIERVHPGHPGTVRISFADRGSMNHAQRVIALASQIWPQGRNNGLGWPQGSMMVSQQHRVLYIPVAKCACTSLKSMMVELAGIDRPEKAIELGVHLVTDRFNTGVQLKDLALETAREILASDRYYKFSVIREPFERLVSAYMEKFVYNRHSARNLLHTRAVISQVQGREDIDLQRGISFDEFIDYILARPPLELDTHWRPQHLYLQGVQHMNRIYRLEDIGQLASQLRQCFGVSVHLAHSNRTRKSAAMLADVATKTAGEIDLVGAFNHASFQSSRHGKAIKRYFSADFQLYQVSAP